MTHYQELGRECEEVRMDGSKQGPGQRYWSLIEPVWGEISIHDDVEVFLRKFRALRPCVGHLFAAHWCQSEVCNGGLRQFFLNSTGVLAPEALEGFRAIGLHEWAAVLEEALRVFGLPYPRDHFERLDLLSRGSGGTGRNRDPFRRLDDRFFEWLLAKDDRWDRKADAYAKKCIA